MIGSRLLRRLRPDTRRSGQAVVEFALISPILLLIIFGLIDFARGWSAHETIADTAREGARVIAVIAATQGVTAAADSAGRVMQRRLSNAALDPARANITYDIGTATGQPSTVTIDYTFDFWLLDVFMNWATGNETVNLVSRITMRNE